MKKILSLILAALLVLSMGTVALAGTTEWTEGDITIDAYLHWGGEEITDVTVNWGSMNFVYTNTDGPKIEAQEQDCNNIDVINYSVDNKLNVAATITVSEELAEAYGITGYVLCGEVNTAEIEAWDGASVDIAPSAAFVVSFDVTGQMGTIDFRDSGDAGRYLAEITITIETVPTQETT